MRRLPCGKLWKLVCEIISSFDCSKIIKEGLPVNNFKRWANHEYPLPVKVFILMIAGILFVFLIPWTMIVPLVRLDIKLGFPSFSFGLINLIAGVLLIGLGLIYAWGSIGLQLFKASGTPVPLIPTQRLLVSGVFSHCRNPMIFGTLCAYTGVAVLVGSISGIILVVLFAILLVIYVKLVEEHELEMRFGQEYLDYKARTPFIIPRIFRRE